jgi:hypothetical protein
VVDADPNFILEMANTHGIRFKKAEKKPEYKHGAIELVNGDLVEGRILIIKGSPLDKQIRVLQWKIDESRQPARGQGAGQSLDGLPHLRPPRDRVPVRERQRDGRRTADARRPSRIRRGSTTRSRSQDDGEFSSLLSEPEWGDLAL